MKSVQSRSVCPISYMLDFLGDKWSLLILRDMMMFDKHTYGEFIASDEKIATNILADRLAMLEKNEFITKQVGLDKKSKNLYSLTDKAIDLVPVLLEIGIWGAKYSDSGWMDGVSAAYLKDREGVVKNIKEKLSRKG